MNAVRVWVCICAIGALPATAQEVQWELIDVEVLEHSSLGRGIEMRIEPDPVPTGFFDNFPPGELFLGLCNHYAPSVIPFLQQQTDIQIPDFIAVRIVSGGFVGRYVFQAFTVSDGQCVDNL